MLWRDVQENVPQKARRKTTPGQACVKAQFSFKFLMLENKAQLQEVHFSGTTQLFIPVLSSQTKTCRFLK